MRKLENVKKWIWIPILLALVALAAVVVIVVNAGNNKTESLFNLSERDVLLEIGESKKVELESEEINIDESKMEVSWVSSKPSVANVSKDGTISATEGGETKVTAIVEYEGKEYSTSCVVTVKSEDNDYSAYKIRWYTQKQDRSGYEIKEETFERLVGSSIELTTLDAKKNMPGNYVLNTEKSILTGKVKKSRAGCILEVYFDVAQVQYTVDYYYESATKLGTYTEKETKKYTAYAFTKVELTEAPKTGFVINKSIAGTVMSKDSVVAGTKLKVYCDRIRSKVTVTYLSGRASATYDCIYGIGLLNAPDDVFTDSTEYKITTYVNGEKKKATKELMKTVTGDTKVAFKLDGVGFDYSLKGNNSTITKNYNKGKTPCYAILNGSSDTIYLSATYKTTGSTTDRFGITLSNGKTSREIRFYNQGFAIMMDNTTTGGVLCATSKTNTFKNAGLYTFKEGVVYVCAQNMTGADITEVSSVITDMVKNRAGGSYDITWAVLDGVLYCNVEGETVLCLPLTCLDKTWTADQKYEIGFSSYDTAWGDSLKISNVNLALGNDAKALLKTDGQCELENVKNMKYDPITGTYLTGPKGGAAYMYGTGTKGNTGISTNVEWLDKGKGNSVSAVGVTLRVGDQSIEYLVKGQNIAIRSQTNLQYENATNIKTIKVTPFKEDGTSEIKAFVKDGYFYIMYNGEQAHCINMLSLFPNYDKDESEVSVGIFSWDASKGLARFSNVTELDATAVAAIDSEEWGFYSESVSADSWDFAEPEVAITGGGYKTAELLGSNATWQIKGTMNRPLDGTTSEVLMGFKINTEDKLALILAKNDGFQIQTATYSKDAKKWNYGSVNKSYCNYTTYASTKYAFNTIVTDKFFNNAGESTRTQAKIDYKAVLYNNTLYVWFTDEAGNSGLCWRIPLTDSKFGGFDKNSVYEVTLYFGNAGEDTSASMTNLDVKMGYQVTEQENFVSDNSNKKYDFCEAMEIIDANINRWDNSFRLKTISGMMAEELDTSWKAGDTVTTKKLNGAAYAYLNGMDSNVYLSATYELESDVKGFGISIQDEKGESRQLFYYVNGVRIYQNHTNAYTDKSAVNAATIIWGQNTTTQPMNTVYTMVHNQGEDPEYNVKWAITDGYIYGMVDDFVFLKMPVSSLCAEWNEDTKFQIGFAQYDIFWSEAQTTVNGSIYNNRDVAITKNIEASFGENALAKMVKNKEVNGASSAGMDYEVFTGSYLPRPSGGLKTLYGTATSDTQVLSTTIKLVDAAKTTSSSGITIKSGASAAQIEVLGNGTAVKISNSLDITSWITAEIFKDGECKVKAVVKDNTLYIFYNDVLAGSVDLYKLLPGYKEGDEVQLGICARNPKNGLSTFSDVSIATGETSIEGITFNRDSEWEIFHDASGNMSNSGAQMSYDGSTGICTPTTGAAGVAYIYGVATNVSQKLETTINQTGDLTGSDYSSNGITVAVGENSVQFYIKGAEKKVTIKNNYTDAPSVQITLPDSFDTSIYKVTAIVKDSTLYIKYSDNNSNTALYKATLDTLFPGSDTTNAKVQLGVCTWDAAKGESKFSDVSFEAGVAIDKIDTKEGYTTIEYIIENSSNASIENGVVSRVMDLSLQYPPATSVTFKGTSTTWEVSGVFNRTDTDASKLAKCLSAGFVIKQGTNTIRTLGYRNGIMFSGGPKTCMDYKDAGNDYVMNAMKSNIFAADNTANRATSVKFRAIISDGKLYVWLDDEPVWRVDLSKAITCSGHTAMNKFDTTKGYSFGLYTQGFPYDCTFSNLTVKTSNIDAKAASDFETAYQKYVENGYKIAN